MSDPRWLPVREALEEVTPCGCPKGMKYHALNCGIAPGEMQATSALDSLEAENERLRGFARNFLSWCETVAAEEGAYIFDLVAQARAVLVREGASAVSAADKLRALEKRIGNAPSDYIPHNDLFAALPALIAFVEAAEQLTSWVSNDHVAYAEEAAVRKALAALDEALGGEE